MNATGEGDGGRTTRGAGLVVESGGCGESECSMLISGDREGEYPLPPLDALLDNGDFDLSLGCLDKGDLDLSLSLLGGEQSGEELISGSSSLILV